MIYYNTEQLKMLKEYFNQMADEDEHVNVDKLCEVLYSFGFVKTP